MSDQEINIAIAEACGWKRLPEYAGAWGRHMQRTYLLPDYCNDLNAMHEAEKVLTGEQLVAYIRLLGHVTQEQKGRCHATARQRAEAFLRTIGKWKEEK